MSIMDMDTLSAAFETHCAVGDRFTRRMAIVLADMDGTTPKQLVLRCERMGLLRRGSWEWFADNGGITNAQIEEVRTTPAPTRPSASGRDDGSQEGADA